MRRPLERSVVSGLVTLAVCLVGAPVAAATWSLQPMPNPPGGGDVFGVSCASRTSCIAVGGRFGGYGHGPATGLVESWNGAKWSLKPAPKPTSASFEGVSCVSQSSCTAVGYDEGHQGTLPLIEAWNGRHWKVQSNPASGRVNGLLAGVSCVSPRSCTAVGYYRKHGGGSQALVERWNGRAWKLQSNPASGQRHSLLTGVTCVSRSFCTAVGRVGHDAFIERFNGKRWKAQSNDGAGASLSGVSCATTARCAAVGAATSSGHTEVPFAESLDGGTWSVDPSAGPSHTTGRTLNAVSCPWRLFCTAVGDGPLAENWDGNSWSTQLVPTPPAAKSAKLAGVSCPSTRLCVAVGGYIGNGYKAYYKPLAEVWKTMGPQTASNLQLLRH